MVWSDVAPDKLKPFGGYKISNLFVNFTDNAVQKALVTLPATTKKAELPWSEIPGTLSRS